MYRLIILIILCATVSVAAVKKTVLDLMVEGRFAEAETLLSENAAGARYLTLLKAMTEPDAAVACKLYRQVSERYPGTDCDSLAQERLLFALEMGVSLDEPQYAEAELSAESAVEEETLSETPATLESAVPLAEKPVAAKAEVPETLEPVASTPAEEPEPLKETETASSGVTIDYQDESAPVTEIQQAAATPDQSLVIPGEKEAEPASAPLESVIVKDSPASEPRADPGAKAPVRIKLDKSALPAGNADLALLDPRPAKEPEPEPGSHDAVIAPQKNGEWFIQVGAFGNHNNAYLLAAKLRSAGYPVILVPRETEKALLMQVRVGGYDTPDHGRTIAAELKQQFDVPAVLVNK